MTIAEWLLAHHLISLLLAIGFAGSVLNQRRPTGSAFAWLLIIFLAPYIGIPLYLSLGARKVHLRKSKELLAPARDPGEPAAQVGWLDEGVGAFRVFLEEIAGAKRSIHLCTFVLGDDETGRALVDALIERAKAGVEVKLLIDDLLYREAPHAKLAELTRAGGHVARFMPLLHIPFRGLANLRNHRKIAVFDTERAIVGGMNLADEYMGPSESPRRWRDLAILVTGRPVATLEAIFHADWQFVTQQPPPAAARLELPAGEVAMQIVPSGPDAATDPLYDAVLTALFRAEKRFWIATPYFVPDETLARALAVAARRGVDVRIVLPVRSNHRLADLVRAPYLRELAALGVDVQLYQPGMLHAKTMLVDDKLAVVGSANFDMRSLFLNYEIALFFSGAAEVARLEEWFAVTARQTRAGLPEAGPVRRRFEEVARLLAPLL